MNLPEYFRVYLISQKSSPVTVKNYVSDVKDFFDWLAKKTGIHYQVAGKAIFGILTKETIEEYQADLLTAKTPLSTINRHLSALRKLGEFARNQGWLSENPAAKISNITAEQARSHLSGSDRRALPEWTVTLKDFRRYLEKEKTSPLTIKNYLSDLRHFLSWLEAT
ncbi:MAG: site-specific integrase [Microgenomates group bacterium]